MLVDGRNVMPDVHAVLDKAADFAERVRAGLWRGHTGRRIRNIVNIGIGGSDLGPVMAYEALRYYSDPRLTFRFVSNVDGADLVEATRGLDAAETLFIVSSKTFTTLETMTNAQSARAWLLASYEQRPCRGREALRRRVDQCREGRRLRHRHREHVRILGLGGRALLHDIGDRSVDDDRDRRTTASVAMLAGFHRMDEHFRRTPFTRNLPVLMGLLGLWNSNFLGAASVAVLPYENYLKRFPAYLQQLVMESNGKQVTREGVEVSYDTSPIYWGEPGTNGQHSFYQLIHQGTRLVPCDFIAFAHPLTPLGRHHDVLIANVLAQSEALAFGMTAEEVRGQGTAAALVPHRVFPGNRPSNMILAERLTPASLGSLVALYEHIVFTQGVIWDVNPFDQWGVELGKALAQNIIPELGSATEPNVAARQLDQQPDPPLSPAPGLVSGLRCAFLGRRPDASTLIYRGGG